MKKLIRMLRKSFAVNLASLLLVVQTGVPSIAAGQGAAYGEPPARTTPAKVAVSASLDNSIRAVDTLMTEQGTILLDDLRWAKSMGYLCRRTKTDIERKVTTAQTNVTELQRMRESGYLDPVRARKIAYALGMEADALAKQARKLDEELSPREQIVSSAGAELEYASRRHQLAVETLSTMSSVLRELARAIVTDLNQKG